jgi:hypothetical protein
MNTLNRIITASCLPLLPLTTAIGAVNREIVPADAQWVVNLDLNALRASVLGQELTKFATAMQSEISQGGIRLNVEKTLATAGSLTAYGTSFSADPEKMDGTLILQGTPELRKIIDALIIQATVSEPDKVKELKDLPFPAYSIGGEVTVALPPEGAIFVSKSKEQVLKARELFRGSGASLAKARSPLSALLNVPAEYFLSAASVVPSAEGLFTGDGPQTRILQMANSGAVFLGEDGKLTVARVQLVAASDDMADRLNRILQGLTAMLSLAESDDQQLAEFLRSVTVERKGSTVVLNLAYPSERLVEMLRSLHEENQRAGSNEEEAPRAPKVVGNIVGEWVADQSLGSDRAAPGNLVTHSIDKVRLVNGAMIFLNGRRNQGENARFDYLEIAPAQGAGQAIRHEAEDMRLTNYNIEEAPFASGGELIIIGSDGSSGSARLKFQGADGEYKLTIGYVDETDGKSTFSVSVQEPQPIPAVEKSSPK